MKIFEEILEMRGMTAIEYKIDAALPEMEEGPAKEALKKMQETRSLDEVWALAHEQLGHHEEAAKLRQWVADKPKRDKSSAEVRAFINEDFPEGK